MGASLNASKYLLSTQHGFREGSNIQLEGGKTPIQVEQNTRLSLGDMEELPLTTKTAILQLIEEAKKEKEKEKS